MKAKLTKWDIQDHLKTAEDRAFYLEAAIDEAVETKDYKFLATAFSDVAEALGGGDISSFFLGVSTEMEAIPTPGTARSMVGRSKGYAFPEVCSLHRCMKELYYRLDETIADAKTRKARRGTGTCRAD